MKIAGLLFVAAALFLGAVLSGAFPDGSRAPAARPIQLKAESLSTGGPAPPSVSVVGQFVGQSDLRAFDARAGRGG